MSETILSNISTIQPEKGYRSLPNNIEAEQAIIGAILINNDIISLVSDTLKAEYFYEPLHSRIFDAISLENSQNCAGAI